ncbi:MAG: hypothetical protein K0Q76_3879 [Panacagrimonas sp.]|jgi:hypothetical protein|nr:hypothetical protein [Panacagrimonas sp.]MCC2658771.1 hypothetical protein [Panacagrimonas sp.]
MNQNNELEMRAGDFGWIVSADALCPALTTLRDLTAALRSMAREEQDFGRLTRAPVRFTDTLTIEPPV